MTQDSQSREYQACDPKDLTRRRSIELRLKDGRRYWLRYGDRHLMALSPDGMTLTMFFYSLSIVILGRNLAIVADALDGENIAWLQEFDGDRWDKPADSAAIVIENVKLYQPKQGKSSGLEAPDTSEHDDPLITAKH